MTVSESNHPIGRRMERDWHAFLALVFFLSFVVAVYEGGGRN